MFVRNPGASLDEVIARSGVARTTLFRHFPQRNDLVRAAGLAALEAVEHALASADLGTGGARDRLLRVFEVLVPHGVKVHFVFVTAEILDDATITAATRRLDPHIMPVMEAAARAGEIDPSIAESWCDDVFDALLYCSWLAVSKGRVAARDAPALLLRTMLHGLGRIPTATVATKRRRG
ncbi:MAG: TetR/AcrR family transcriptional regulator [Deltaproteobacteria bacterium]|nr:TetR/AcrR family transcriptional regulator [Nannocystaceae bacterium]